MTAAGTPAGAAGAGGGGEAPTECPQCGGAWVFQSPWWDSAQGGKERWGYVMHCRAGHFAWHEAELDADELAAAKLVLERRTAAAAAILDA